MSTKDTDPTHSIDLNTTELDVIKTVLPKLQLNDDIHHFRLEIESDSPITIPDDEESDEPAESKPEPEPEPEDEPEEPIEDDEPGTIPVTDQVKCHGCGEFISEIKAAADADAPECPKCGGNPLPPVGASDDEPAETEHPTDRLLSDSESEQDTHGDLPTRYSNHDYTRDQQTLLEQTDATEPAAAYLEAIDEHGQTAVDPAAFANTPLNGDTHKWFVTAALYRSQGKLTSRDIYEILDSTSWELGINVVSATVTDLRKGGLIVTTDIEGERFGRHQLTQLGRDLMREQILEADEYPLTVIDKATGKHPTSKAKA